MFLHVCFEELSPTCKVSGYIYGVREVQAEDDPLNFIRRASTLPF